MTQKYFLGSWLLPLASLTPHRQPTPKNGLRHFSALPTHHPNTSEQQKIYNFFQYFLVFLRLNNN